MLKFAKQKGRQAISAIWQFGNGVLEVAPATQTRCNMTDGDGAVSATAHAEAMLKFTSSTVQLPQGLPLQIQVV